MHVLHVRQGGRSKYTVEEDEEPTRVSVQADALGRSLRTWYPVSAPKSTEYPGNWVLLGSESAWIPPKTGCLKTLSAISPESTSPPGYLAHSLRTVPRKS